MSNFGNKNPAEISIDSELQSANTKVNNSSSFNDNPKCKKTDEIQKDDEKGDKAEVSASNSEESDGSGTTLNTANILKARDQSSRKSKRNMIIILMMNIFVSLLQIPIIIECRIINGEDKKKCQMTLFKEPF